MSDRMPALFLGHGNPMNAIANNDYTAAWSALGVALPRPEAVLCVSAHWYRPGAAVTAMERPRTIHDFGGFPQPLYEVQYPAPGDPALARRVAALLAPEAVEPDAQWGLDHGTWSVLMHVFPEADIPVLQLAIDEPKPSAWHFDFARRLQPLRDEGVLVMGSGNLVHNLHTYAWGRHGVEPFDWALRFEAFARERMSAGDFAPLVAYETLGRDAMLSAPTPDHYLPLLYVAGASVDQDVIQFPTEGFDGGSVSMLGVQFG